MSRTFKVGMREESLRRRVLFAVELLDAVTLARVTQGVQVVAEGLKGKPTVNAGGLFVWLQEDIDKLERVSIDPGELPFDKKAIEAADLKVPHQVVEMIPRADYPFPAGITGLRGTLVEERETPPEPSVPIGNAEVRLQWVDEDGAWHDAPITSQTSSRSGDFAAFLRLTAAESPPLDAGGNLSVRLRVRRDSGVPRFSPSFQLLQGRVADPTTSNPLIFGWNEMQP